MNQLYVKKLHPNAVLPHYAHPGEDAAFDLYCLELVNIQTNVPIKIPLGFSCQFQAGYFAHILGRSSLAKQGMCILGGVIDSGYRGEWSVMMVWVNDKPLTSFISAGAKIAQCAIIPCPEFQIVETDTLTESARGEKGFGSTDNNRPYKNLHAP